jgi:flagella basal body P-ring formation protein FlgA
MEFIMENTNQFSLKKDAARIALVTTAAMGVWFAALGAAAHADPVDDALATVATAPVIEAGTEKFVPNLSPISCSGTLEMLKLAEIPGKQIRVRQVARWSTADAPSFAPIADLVIDQFDGSSNRKLSLEELRSTLTGAGVNLGLVRFAGANSCLLSHVEGPEPVAATDDRAVVQQWIEQKNTVAVTAAAPASPGDTAANGGEVADAECSPFHTLRDRMLIDLSQRLNLPIDQLQMTFDPKDRGVLNLAEPGFRFELEPRRVRDLGRVVWDVTIMTGDKQRTVEVSGDARAWQKQLVVEKAANYKQVLRDEDLSERRVLVDHLSDDALLTRSQVVGQQAARDLKPGAVLTARLIDPVPLARLGQPVTVTLIQGGVMVRTVATAMESGSFGQSIKVRSRQTQDVFDVTLTARQEGSIGAPQTDAKLASDQQ